MEQPRASLFGQVEPCCNVTGRFFTFFSCKGKKSYGCSTGLEEEHLYLGLLLWLPTVRPVTVCVRESKAFR